MILGTVQLEAKVLQCNECGWPHDRSKPWYSIAKRLPKECPNRRCRSKEWNGQKPRKPPMIKLPKPKKGATP